jgi:hypothetical protein
MTMGVKGPLAETLPMFKSMAPVFLPTLACVFIHTKGDRETEEGAGRGRREMKRHEEGRGHDERREDAIRR